MGVSGYHLAKQVEQLRRDLRAAIGDGDELLLEDWRLRTHASGLR